MRNRLIILGLAGLVVALGITYPVCKGHIASRQLVKAVKENNITLVKSLIGGGANTNTEDDEGTPLLFIAVFKGNKEIVQLLLTNGTDPDVVWRVRDNVAGSIIGQTALQWAVKVGDIELMKVLLENGADVNVQDEKGCTPLHCAAILSRILDSKREIVELLSSYGANINVRDNNGNTPLYFAIAGNQIEMVRLLLAQGADVNVRSNSGVTPLHSAAASGGTDIANMLLKHGADVNAKNNESRTPLDIAVDRGHTEIAELLKKHGARRGS